MANKRRLCALASALLCSAPLAFGANFDGSTPLICATVDAHGCDAGDVCLRDLPDGFGLPRFLRIDFAKKAVEGPKRTTAVRFMDQDANQILLQGTELGYAWSLVIDKADGSMAMTLVNREDVYVVFGYCTPP
jgi:hypothetical protein